MMVHPVKPTPRGVRFVDVKLAIPSDGTYPTPGNMMTRSFHPLSVSPSTPVKVVNITLSASSFSFVPLVREERSPPSSPYGFNKPAASPALTATTVDTCESPALLEARVTPPIPVMISRYTPSPVQLCRPVAKRFTPSPRNHHLKSSNDNMTKKKLFTRDDDSVRKTRIKTELCMHFERGDQCPFGANCTYAHGEEELQMTKLLDLQSAGLIGDVHTYRQLPCLTYVATGSCPFGKRCTNIHDTRVAGAFPSWLPHTETQGNSIDTDINVESLYQKRSNAMLYGNPFGGQFVLGMDDAEELYKLVTNQSNKLAARKRQGKISMIHKIDIALQMIGGPEWHYKYCPKHFIYGELCMVLQKRAFRLTNGGQAIEIDENMYNPRSPNHVMVTEIAFGPDSEDSVRGVALWFNVPEHEVTECTQQQSKRYRWKKGLNTDSKFGQNSSRGSSSSSPFEYMENFFMIRPHDNQAFELTKRILEHRLAALKSEKLSSSSMRELSEEREVLKGAYQTIKVETDLLIRHWTKWACPIMEGRDIIDEESPVPAVEQDYIITSKGLGKRGLVGTETEKVWNSFVEFFVAGNEESGKNRLEPFRMLGRGEPIDPDRRLTHLLSNKRKHDPSSSYLSPVKDSDQCWKSLLLNPTPRGTTGGRKTPTPPTEWDLVYSHFEKSRSKKVLTILQSQ